jgi:alpha-glucosidase
VGLLEADLTDYSGMYVGGVPGVENALLSKLSPTRDRMDQVVVGSTPKTTPWRVLLINSRAGGLIESNYIVLDLSAPCALTDTSWIQPGKSAWDWWSGSFAKNVDFKPGMNTATMKHYIDFAAEHHLEYMLVDAGWYPAQDYTHALDILHHVPEVDVPDIIAYGKQKGVKVLLWLFWSALDKQMDEAMSLYEKWGAAGIKVDFMDHDDQEMVNFYTRCIRKAADHHLVVDFHGAYKPTGLRRTYPNLLTREGVMGMEYSKWSDRVTPEHDVTIPFTRMLAGPMDFTPGAFNNAALGHFVARNVEPMSQGTRAHQLAMYVVYESPLVMLSDYPEAYDHNPGMEFLDKVPTVWDDTKVLNGEPAEYITVARQHGDAWYLGSMTNWKERDLELPLDFLGKGQYEAQIFSDGPDADTVGTSLSINTKRVKPSDKLNVHLAPGGGWAAIFTPLQ